MYDLKPTTLIHNNDHNESRKITDGFTDAERRVQSDAVRHSARDCGFDAVGIARAEPLDEAFGRYLDWRRSGMSGPMPWLDDRESRRDVRAILPEARSVVVVAQNYYVPVRHGPNAVGKISRYAWGDDYHDVIPEKLDRLRERIREIVPGSVDRRYTDTGAILEKEWAVRAGLAWQGKHSNVLRRDIGSWFFLGLVITSADLEPDAPVMDYCGTCTACMDACPTHAIVAPYVVDARSCISTWTIETKPDVEIADHIAANLDGWLFGCDTCQDVCPWNRFATDVGDPRFAPRDGVTELAPEAVVDLQPEEFRARFRKSPVQRTKLDGLRRNARALLSKKS